MGYTELSENSEGAIRALLQGRRIVSAERGTFRVENHWESADGRLTLDDGTQILVIPNTGGCSCGAGDYDLAHLATVDNVITDVRLAEETEDTDDWGEGPKQYRIYVIADATEVNILSVEGDDGNGYYGTGYALIIVPAISGEN